MWTCDTCGQPIKTAKDGWVEWIRDINGENERGLRLVHAYPASPFKDDPKCQYGRGYIRSDLSLEDFLGSDGLMRLLQQLHEKSLPEEEVMEMIKRLHIPGYEQARHFADEAISRGIVDPRYGRGFYDQDQIESIIEYSHTK